VSDNPLEHSTEREARIRERAYHLWETEGRPEDRDAEFWERAELLIGMEDSQEAGRLPDPSGQHPRGAAPDGVEEADIQENYGEFPDRFVDQGQRRQTPRRRAAKDHAAE
jgi:DUF2934 family protein